jgi:hypothetical protein
MINSSGANPNIQGHSVLHVPDRKKGLPEKGISGADPTEHAPLVSDFDAGACERNH